MWKHPPTRIGSMVSAHSLDQKKLCCRQRSVGTSNISKLCGTSPSDDTRMKVNYLVMIKEPYKKVNEVFVSKFYIIVLLKVTINCGERGLLLLRVRDEARITMEAYQTLYCSSIAFGMRKALQV